MERRISSPGRKNEGQDRERGKSVGGGGKGRGGDFSLLFYFTDAFYSCIYMTKLAERKKWEENHDEWRRRIETDLEDCKQQIQQQQHHQYKKKIGEAEDEEGAASSSMLDKRIREVEESFYEEASLRYDEIEKAQQDLQVSIHTYIHAHSFLYIYMYHTSPFLSYIHIHTF